MCPTDLVLLVRSGPVIRDLGGSVRIWVDIAPVLISCFYDRAAPVKVFQNRSQSGFYMDNRHVQSCMSMTFDPLYVYGNNLYNVMTVSFERFCIPIFGMLFACPKRHFQCFATRKSYWTSFRRVAMQNKMSVKGDKTENFLRLRRAGPTAAACGL